MKNLTEKQLKEEAQKRVDFKKHLIVYIVIIAFLWVIWAVTGSGYIWPIWPMAGWGLGIIFHYVSVYNPLNFFPVEKEMGKAEKRERQ